MAHIGADNPFVSEVLDRTEIFTSHEALLLDYEEKLTRQGPGGGWFDGSAHYVWVGERTRELDGAHIEFIRGVENPIGVKLGPSLEGGELVRLLDVVNPKCEIGKVTLISRYGHKNVRSLDDGSGLRLGCSGFTETCSGREFFSTCWHSYFCLRPYAWEYVYDRPRDQNETL